MTVSISLDSFLKSNDKKVQFKLNIFKDDLAIIKVFFKCLDSINNCKETKYSQVCSNWTHERQSDCVGISKYMYWYDAFGECYD